MEELEIILEQEEDEEILSIVEEDGEEIVVLEEEDTIVGMTEKEVKAITGELKYLATKDKSDLVCAINEVKYESAFAYNFKTVTDKWTYNPADAQALEYMVKNWKTKPMCVSIQGYPIIVLNLEGHRLTALKDNRYVYSFDWDINGSVTQFKLYARAVAELTYKTEVENYIEFKTGKLTDLVTKNKINLVSAINEVKEEHFIYNFATISEEMLEAPEDIQAIDYIIENWKKKPMYITIQGYPVINIDTVEHLFKVLYNERYIYTFNWRISDDLKTFKLVPYSTYNEIAYNTELKNSIDRLSGTIKKYIDDQDASLKKYIDDEIAKLKQ